MSSNYKVAYEQEWNKLKKLDLIEVCKRLEVECDNDKKQITVPYFKENYILDFTNETIYREKDENIPPIGDSIIILNYLTYSAEYIVNTNKWVSLKEIPNGGVLFYPAFHKSSIQKIIKEFGYNIEKFQENAIKVGARQIKFGDVAYEFQVLPKIKVCIAIWEGDDEISPNATILFEPSIAHLVHIETVIGIGMCVANKVIF